MKPHSAILIFVITCLVSVEARAQSLADVARQARAQRQSVPSRAVFTNSSVTPQLPALAEPGKEGASLKAETGDISKSVGPTDNKGRDERYWRSTFEAARLDLKRSQDKLTILDLKMNDLHTQLLNVAIYTSEVVIRADIEKTHQEQEAARLEFDARQQKLQDLEDELRRSGGPPGWAR